MKNSLVGIGSMLAVIVIESACAHLVMRGSVARVEGPDEAQVCLGNHEVKPGDKVALYRMECSGVLMGRAGVRPCRKIRLGEGVVSRTLDEHMSVVKVEPGIRFKEGTIVEKE